jgi:hypothetical protein
MLAIISKIIPMGKLIGLGLAALIIGAGVLYVAHLRSSNAALALRISATQAQLNEVQAANQANLRALDILQAQAIKDQAALAGASAGRAKAAGTSASVSQSVHDAPAAQTTAQVPPFIAAQLRALAAGQAQ